MDSFRHVQFSPEALAALREQLREQLRAIERAIRDFARCVADAARDLMELVASAVEAKLSRGDAAGIGDSRSRLSERAKAAAVDRVKANGHTWGARDRPGQRPSSYG